MPVYIDYQGFDTQEATRTGNPYAVRQDTVGNPWIRQALWPATANPFVYSNFPSKYDAESVTGVVQASGTVHATPIYLPGGYTVSNLSVVMGTTTSSALSHRWFALFDSALVLRASTADDTTAVPTVSTVCTLPIAKVAGATATAYKVPTTYSASTGAPEGGPVLYYFGILMAGTTIGSMVNKTGSLWSVTAVPKSGSTDLTSKTVALTTDGTVSIATITPLITVPMVGVS